jgi:hypothetical protein
MVATPRPAPLSPSAGVFFYEVNLAKQDAALTQNHHSGWKANESLYRGRRLVRATLSREAEVPFWGLAIECYAALGHALLSWLISILSRRWREDGWRGARV